MRYFWFFVIWILVLAAGYFYVGRRLSRGFSAKHRSWLWAAVGLAFLLPQFPFFLLRNRIESGALDVLIWCGYVTLGLFSSLLTGVLLRDLVLGTRRLWVRVRRTVTGHNRPVDMERRRFLLHSTNLGIMGLAAGFSSYGFFEAHGPARIEEVAVELPNLPPTFDRFRVAQFTDLHVGPTIKRAFVERVAEQVAGLNADLIVFTGDLADGSVPWLREDVAPLRELSAAYGKFFITGNHEYYSGVLPWLDEARRLGFDVLLNENRTIQRGSEEIIVAGVTDYTGGSFLEEHRSDPAKAAMGAANGLVKVLLAHQPRSVFEAEAAGFDLQISGHTHGGQFFPWNHLATLNQPFIKGLHRRGRTWVYVSRGTGYWGPPLRFGIPPEITAITLRRTS